MIRMRGRRVLTLAVVCLAAGCAPAMREESPAPPAATTAAEPQEWAGGKLRSVAESDRRWTGVTVSKEGRIFVNYPRWSDDVPVSVAEVTGFRTTRPYPDAEWNRWNPSLDPGTHFVCVQSVVVDDRNDLWILDPANPRFAGVVPGGPKLVQVDLGTGKVKRTLLFPPDIAPKGSYLNDLRIDTKRQTVYITDSGSAALVVVDLATGTSRRLLTDHPSTRSEGVTLSIGGRPWTRDVHADGIALSPNGDTLYYQALTGRTLYRIPTEALRDPLLSAKELASRVERVGETGAADGLLVDPEGNLYISALEHDAVRRLTPDGRLETVVQHPRISWPDSFALTPQGDLLVTTTQIHHGNTPPEPYRILRVAR